MAKNLYKPAFLLCMAVAAFFLAARPAQASFQLIIQEDASATNIVTITVPNNQGPAFFSGTLGDFSIGLSFDRSSSPVGLIENSNSFITNNSSSSHTLHVRVSAQGFTSPNSPPPLILLSTVAGSVSTGGTVAGDFQAYADATGALFGTGFVGQDITFSATGPSGSFSGNGSAGGFSPNGAAYSLSTIGNYNFDGGTSVTLTGGNAQTLATPVPASMVLALSGMPMLVLGYWLRRRQVRLLPVA